MENRLGRRCHMYLPQSIFDPQISLFCCIQDPTYYTTLLVRVFSARTAGMLMNHSTLIEGEARGMSLCQEGNNVMSSNAPRYCTTRSSG